MKITLLQLFVVSSVFAQLAQLRPEIVELYRLQDIAKQSRTLNSDDLIATHEAFFNNPLFCEVAFGLEYIRFANMLIRQGEQEKAEEYFLKATKSQYIKVSNHLVEIFNRASNWFEIMYNRLNYTISDSAFVTISDTVFVIPRTSENMRFKEAMFEKILEIEKKQIIDPRIVAIVQETEEMFNIDQAVRTDSGDIFWIGFDSIMRSLVIEAKKKNLSQREVDSMNIYRLIELIKENPDIDVLRIVRHHRAVNPTRPILLHSLRYNARFARTAWTDFFEPYFRKQAENGKGLEYCYWYDVYQWHVKGGIPYYGEYNLFGILFEDEELKEINERRERIGLLPLANSAI